MTLDSLQTLLLGSLFATTLTLLVLAGFLVGFGAWGWSWAARFDSMSATRDQADGVVTVVAKLKPKAGKKVRKLVPASNGVRHVEKQARGQA